MKTFILTQILRPSIDRVASQAAMLLTGFGLSSGQIDTVVAGVTILGGLAIDLLVRKVGK